MQVLATHRTLPNYGNKDARGSCKVLDIMQFQQEPLKALNTGVPFGILPGLVYKGSSKDSSPTLRNDSMLPPNDHIGQKIPINITERHPCGD